MLQLKPSFQARFLKFFRKRELYLRSDGHIHYMALEPFMLMLVAGFTVALLSLGIIGGVSYMMAGSTITTLQENLSSNMETKISSTDELVDQKKKYEADLEKLRASYEIQLSRFQSSLAQVNGRLAKNQAAYLKELERLRAARPTRKSKTPALEKY